MGGYEFCWLLNGLGKGVCYWFVLLCLKDLSVLVVD